MHILFRHGRRPAAALVVLALLVAPAAAAQTAGSVEQRLQRLERALDNQGLLDLVRQVELLQQEVRQLRGELENQIFALEQVRKSQRETYVDLDGRLGQVERGGAAVAAAPALGALPAAPGLDPPLPTLAVPADASIAGDPATQTINVDVQTPAPLAPAPAPLTPDDRTVAIITPDAATTTAPPESTAVIIEQPRPSIRPQTPTIDSAESEAAYREAFALLKAGQYEESIAGFNAYLEQYPASQYADNAQYWLGEAHYVMRRFEDAITQYQALVDRYPDSKKRSHAMLKIAYSYDELGKADQAVGVLGDLKRRFAGSAAARLADERLERIRAEAP